MALSMKMVDGLTVLEVDQQTIHLKAEALKLSAAIQQWADQLPDKLPRVRTKPKPQPQKRVAAPRPARKAVAGSSDGAETEAAATV